MLDHRWCILVLSSDPSFVHPVCEALAESEIGTVVCQTIDEFSERAAHRSFNAVLSNTYGLGPEWNGATLAVIQDSKIPVIMVTGDSNRLGRQLAELGFTGTVWFCQSPKEIADVLGQIARVQPSSVTL